MNPGIRRPSPVTSSPNAKGDKETQQPKKKAKHMVDNPLFREEQMAEDTLSPIKEPMGSPIRKHHEAAWTGGVSRKLFGNVRPEDEWYIAESDSEDIAEAMREDDLDDEIPEDDDLVALQ
ncbi:unnamed protein product [Linum trigynum]|uniref:Uncharacterized protein n=1 Tax=Linum trigynum TaxID=586398 RepID=A0AAV2FFG4_9ROSI